MFAPNRILVKERVKLFKSHQTYDILDAANGQPIGIAEEEISGIVKLLRWFISKQLMPTRIEIRDLEGKILFSIGRGWYLFRSRVEVLDAEDKLIGYFKSKVFSIGGGFHVYDANDKHFAEVKGNFIGFNYRVLTPDHSVQLGNVSKKWEGMLREMFTSADTYCVEVAPELEEQGFAKMLVLAAALAVDTIFKSESRTSGSGILDSVE